MFALNTRGCLNAFVASRAQSRVLHDHILRDIGIYGMDLNFDKALDGLSVVIPKFKLSSFTRNDVVPLKAQHVFGECLF